MPAMQLQTCSPVVGVSVRTFVFLLCFVCLSAQAKIPRSKAAVSEFKRQNACPTTGLRKGKCPGYQIDHIVPLKCAGADRPENMQWLTIEQHKAKTKSEAKLCRIRK